MKIPTRRELSVYPDEMFNIMLVLGYGFFLACAFTIVGTIISALWFCSHLIVCLGSRDNPKTTDYTLIVLRLLYLFVHYVPMLLALAYVYGYWRP